MTRDRLRSSCRGFTLVEVVVAVLLLAVGVVALAGTSRYVLASLRRSADASAAAALLDRAADSLRSRGCANVAAGSARTAVATDEWTIAVGSRSVAVRHVVSLRAPRRGHDLRLEELLPCDPR